MKQFLKQTAKNLLHVSTGILTKHEYKNQVFRILNERPVEYAFIFKHISKIYPMTLLDVGTGMSALPQLYREYGPIVTAADNVKDYWPYGMHNRHYKIVDDDITDTKITEQFDFVSCISVLEHIVEYDAAMANLAKLTKPGGHLILTFPYQETEYCPNVYKLPESAYGQDKPYITQAFSRNEVDRWLAENNLEIVDEEFWQFWDGKHWTQGTQMLPPKLTGADQAHQHANFLFRKKA